ncbi:MAG: ABC transporter permease [Deltaproteobacteria bacterium]|nr:ABC transporter permease [Deltaproteobacteria bacterium]
MWTHLRTALHLFASQKIRFLLTVSGIVVGVASLVILASFLTVGQRGLQESSARAAGEDVITVQNDWQVLNDNPDAKRIDRHDQENVGSSTLLPDLTVGANYGLRDAKAVFGTEPFEPLIIGIEPAAFEIHRLAVEKGRTFTADEYTDVRRVAIAGAKVLDGRVKPGDVIRVEGRPYVLVGVLEEKQDMGPGGFWSWNRRILFPARTFNLEFNPSRRPTNIVAKVDPPVTLEGPLAGYVANVRDLMTVVLMHGRTVKSFDFGGAGEESDTEEQILLVIELLVYLTTVFSMVVGGINIMNIMLVTVAERTREIGLRRALGATQGDILRQFLTETVMVTLIGCVLGIVAAVVLLAIAGVAMTRWVMEWPFYVEGWSVALSVVFSAVIGMICGMYPAWRASRLDPVEALRTD